MDERQETPDVAIGHLKKHIDILGPDVYAVQLSQNGELMSSSTNPEDDQTMSVYYPPLQDVQRPKHVNTVLRSELLELNRFGPNVDLVSYLPRGDATEQTKVAFKYYILSECLHKFWHEMNVWMRLPAHPNIVPFDRLVLDELRGRVVGFTSLYIPGGTLDQHKSRMFKLEWLQQLISVVDDLNFKYGIAHQDIATRNLLIDPKTDALMLFDFNYCGQIGGIGYGEDRNDVQGVIFTLYDIITGDTHFQDVRYSERNPADVQELEEWVQHPDVKLDHPVSEYRAVLNDWVYKRQAERQISHYKEESEYIEWPEFPQPPPEDWPCRDIKGNIVRIGQRVFLARQRRGERERGKAVVEWERPAQTKLKDRDRLLANGQFAPDN
ncbi:hypothetical protein TRIATDRAFT_45984 [Trichoderma atroviride IMI 206040]|uniref:Protein kinase domain-containing protein n=1 Tax=Hypocrea atroviridis (strain ATCC 20476 / IMI 206040) TaxID=452589 RepID=G9NQX1_HYPAI|nr:uncharacterized protein TRIATDRAFT_45984 [Trichoderma atroviride IMI 206040]EHK46941.1 hypothetical protein TRIATDRAFT_45984 [Trichoderma atroviride IMI 206040]